VSPSSAGTDIKPGITQFSVPSRLVNASESFLQEQGRAQHEAVVLWIGRVVSDTEAVVDDAYVPDQTPIESDDGVGVYISGEAITKLILSLEGDQRVLARLHSHPAFAYHSETDDLNRLISHEGAISVVVPYFARLGIRLDICSTNELDANGVWRELAPVEVERRFRFT
jgi:hypothetical protein